jgi:hypothetical protein
MRQQLGLLINRRLGSVSRKKKTFFARVGYRVARWYIFKPKIPVWINFEGRAMEDLGIFYGHLVIFSAIW